MCELDRKYNGQLAELTALAVRLRKLQKLLYRCDDHVEKSRYCEAIGDVLADSDKPIQFYHAAADMYKEAVSRSIRLFRSDPLCS